ncbi:MAG: sugar MFS transporter [Anaerolineales bacterium]
MKITKTSLWLWTAAAFFAFFVFGFSDNLKGAVLPALLQDLRIDYTVGGSILLGLYIGFMIATATTGLIADALGKKTVLLMAGVSLALGVTGFSNFSMPILLGLSMAVLGYGLGALELGCNAIIVELHPGDKGRYLNLMSVMHGMGSMAAPFFAGLLLAAGASWRTVYRWDYLLIGILLVYVLLNRYPAIKSGSSDKIDFAHVGQTAFTPRMLWLYAAIVAYVAAEIGIASWMPEYLQKVRGQGVEASTQALSLYFGLMMVGRFVGSFFIERLGYLKSILIAMLGASLCIALGLAAFPFALTATGFFLSIVFPTITAAASDGLTENTNTILGLLFTFAGLGGMLGPWLVGFASDYFGIDRGWWLNLGFALLTALSAMVLLQRSRKKNAFNL